MGPGTVYLIIVQFSYLTQLTGSGCTLSTALLAIDLMLSKPSLLIPHTPLTAKDRKGLLKGDLNAAVEFS